MQEKTSITHIFTFFYIKIRLLPALAFIPINEVEKAFEKLLDSEYYKELSIGQKLSSVIIKVVVDYQNKDCPHRINWLRHYPNAVHKTFILLLLCIVIILYTDHELP